MKTLITILGQLTVAAGIWSAILHFLVYLAFNTGYGSDLSTAILIILL